MRSNYKIIIRALDWQCLDIDFDFPFCLIKRLCAGYFVRGLIPDSNCIAGAGVLCQGRFANFNWPTLLSSSRRYAIYWHLLLSDLEWVVSYIEGLPDFEQFHLVIQLVDWQHAEFVEQVNS